MFSKEITLESLINPNIINSIQNNIFNIIDFPILIVTIDGTLIGDADSLIPSYITSHTFTNVTQPQIHCCDEGFNLCISPVTVSDSLLCNIVCGPFYRHPQPVNQLNNIPILSEVEIKKRLHICNLLAQYLSGMATNQLLEQQLVNYKNEAGKAQLKLLESQINPHFLFNTLNCISRMALLENSPKTEELIYCLSDLLRYTVQQSEDFPTIDSVLQNIEKYLFIQGTRYKDRISYTINVPEDVREHRIPSMILQPIIENALIHGLEPKATGGNIHIEGTLLNQKIIITIKDTGVGIPPLQLKTLLDQKEMANHIGIINPHIRLSKYFGSEYGLKIYSTQNIGTTVEIHFPCFKDLSILADTNTAH